ncbi:exported protein of unknown function [Rhodovastum atsumiense]|nr:exported protein of unknown function [Rhodovastum atsumiense]
MTARPLACRTRVLPACLAILLGAPAGMPRAADAPQPRRPAFVLPVVPPAAPGPTRPMGPGFMLRRVEVTDNTVLPDSVITDLTTPFVGHAIDAAGLEELRTRLTMAYVERGYINSGAVLPDQEIRDGVVTYRVIEGRVTDIEVTGTRWLSPRYVRNRLANITPPLNIHNLEAHVQFLLQDPVIQRMNVELVPGLAPGEARLVAEVTERPLLSLGASVSNDTPPNVGSLHGQLNATLRSLTGWGDALDLYYGRTGGMNEGSVAWALPLTEGGTTFSVRWDYNGAGVVSEPFQDLNIDSTTQTVGVAVSVPLYRSVARADVHPGPRPPQQRYLAARRAVLVFTGICRWPRQRQHPAAVAGLDRPAHRPGDRAALHAQPWPPHPGRDQSHATAERGLHDVARTGAVRAQRARHLAGDRSRRRAAHQRTAAAVRATGDRRRHHGARLPAERAGARQRGPSLRRRADSHPRPVGAGCRRMGLARPAAVRTLHRLRWRLEHALSHVTSPQHLEHRRRPALGHPRPAVRAGLLRPRDDQPQSAGSRPAGRRHLLPHYRPAVLTAGTGPIPSGSVT